MPTLAIVALLLSWPAVFAMSSGDPADGSYLVGVRRDGVHANQFCAELAVLEGAFRLQSEVHPDIVLAPEHRVEPGAELVPGRYALSLDGGDPDARGIPVTGSDDGSSLLFLGTAGVDVRLTPKGCPRELPPAAGWFSPFRGGSRRSYGAIARRVVGKFGDRRALGAKGRKHAGVDLKGALNEAVYPIAAGRVIALSF